MSELNEKMSDEQLGEVVEALKAAGSLLGILSMAPGEDVLGVALVTSLVDDDALGALEKGREMGTDFSRDLYSYMGAFAAVDDEAGANFALGLLLGLQDGSENVDHMVEGTKLAVSELNKRFDAEEAAE